jgi:hypothetical protein
VNRLASVFGLTILMFLFVPPASAQSQQQNADAIELGDGEPPPGFVMPKPLNSHALTGG